MVGAGLLTATTMGCLPAEMSPVDQDVELLLGADSAGASIEIEKRAGNFASARVADAVLGVADAPVIESEGRISFTIEFPTGAIIAYIADRPEVSADLATIEGRWIQRPGGVFGGDAGTWSVQRHATVDP